MYKLAAALILTIPLSGCLWPWESAPKKADPPPVKVVKDAIFDTPAPVAIPGRLSFTPPGMTFTEVKVGDTSENVSILKNEGSEQVAFAIDAPSIDGLKLDGECFMIQRKILPPGATCTVRASFAPKAKATINTVINATAPGIPGAVLTIIAIAQAPVVEQKPATAAYDDTADRRARLQRQFLNTPAPLAPTIPARELRVSQEDWTDMGWRKNTASLKVDLSRTILRMTAIRASTGLDLDSQMGCPATAHITADVYAHMPKAGLDPETGITAIRPLIPWGSIVTGSCQAVGGQYQTKIAFIWSRITTPDGRAINVDAPTLGADGRAGVTGYRNDHFAERLLKAGLVTLVDAVTTFAVSSRSGTQQQISSINPITGQPTISQAITPLQQSQTRLQQGITDTARMLAEDAIDLRPEFFIPSGTEIIIFPQTDLWFEDSLTVPKIVKRDLPPPTLNTAPLARGTGPEADRIKRAQDNLEGATYNPVNPPRSNVQQPANSQGPFLQNIVPSFPGMQVR
jgi:type IV secretory pathway VirB10-like protein